MKRAVCRNREARDVFVSRIAEVRTDSPCVIVTECGAERVLDEPVRRVPCVGDWLLISVDGSSAVITDEQYQARCTPVVMQ